MPEPDYAVVELLCDPAELEALAAIPNLEIEVRPIRTSDPALVRISALADEGAQAAALALGCTVTIVKSAADYRRQIEDAYRDLGKDPTSSGPR
ncbi:hypothetical protein [Mesorhizobium sp. WSM2561]|uniref:hypothetical protein n=1 Tax=Mesorhizobium sp. WSM2561 TaxID=1040985 RepID=UPI000485527D|nr:hypothetical protein [Mesorhizobium sp. WSM2561]